MMILKGISYNFKGLVFGLKNPRLLMLGLARLFIMFVFSIIGITLVLSNYQEIAQFIWNRPDNPWITWIWYVITALLTVLFSAIAGLVSYLISQLLFSIVIMDYMSRITERVITGREVASPNMSWFSHFIFLFKQEVPRATLPILITMVIMVIGWLTPLSPFVTIISPIIAGTFLAWDNTDLVPARRMISFRDRIQLLRKNLIFHVGFGLAFLIPGLNILLLSFAPVGATIYHIDMIDKETDSPASQPPSA